MRRERDRARCAGPAVGSRRPSSSARRSRAGRRCGRRSCRGRPGSSASPRAGSGATSVRCAAWTAWSQNARANIAPKATREDGEQQADPPVRLLVADRRDRALPPSTAWQGRCTRSSRVGLDEPVLAVGERLDPRRGERGRELRLERGVLARAAFDRCWVALSRRRLSRSTARLTKTTPASRRPPTTIQAIAARERGRVAGPRGRPAGAGRLARLRLRPRLRARLAARAGPVAATAGASRQLPPGR